MYPQVWTASRQPLHYGRLPFHFIDNPSATLAAIALWLPTTFVLLLAIIFTGQPIA